MKAKSKVVTDERKIVLGKSSPSYSFDAKFRRNIYSKSPSDTYIKFMGYVLYGEITHVRIFGSVDCDFATDASNKEILAWIRKVTA
jgi:hypothetical protein